MRQPEVDESGTRHLDSSELRQRTDLGGGGGGAGAGEAGQGGGSSGVSATAVVATDVRATRGAVCSRATFALVAFGLVIAPPAQASSKKNDNLYVKVIR
jgi:hypothetical protein